LHCSFEKRHKYIHYLVLKNGCIGLSSSFYGTSIISIILFINNYTNVVWNSIKLIFNSIFQFNLFSWTLNLICDKLGSYFILKHFISWSTSGPIKILLVLILIEYENPPWPSCHIQSYAQCFWYASRERSFFLSSRGRLPKHMEVFRMQTHCNPNS